MASVGLSGVIQKSGGGNFNMRRIKLDKNIKTSEQSMTTKSNSRSIPGQQ
jgi:hypothetical protein